LGIIEALQAAFCGPAARTKTPKASSR